MEHDHEDTGLAGWQRIACGALICFGLKDITDPLMAGGGATSLAIASIGSLALGVLFLAFLAILLPPS